MDGFPNNPLSSRPPTLGELQRYAAAIERAVAQVRPVLVRIHRIIWLIENADRISSVVMADSAPLTRAAAVAQILAQGKRPGTRGYSFVKFETDVRRLCGAAEKDKGFDRRTLRRERDKILPP
jgi:hypothetical protein